MSEGRAATLRGAITRCRVVVALGVALVMAGCGSSSNSAGGGGSHDSPEGAVRGFVAALTAWDGTAAGLTAVAEWIAPSQRTGFTSGFAALTATGGSIKLSFKIDNFTISSVDSSSSDHAVVHVGGTGSYCFSGAIAGTSQNFCTTAPLTPSGTSDTVETVNVGGRWYVDTKASGAAGSTSSSTDTGTPSSTT
ncbi:MAG TPA: hypothetical protein VI316_08000 [Candidatus Dormibacteraeota bacterium]